MIRNVIVSAGIGLALFSASVRLPAAPCVVTNTPSPKACQPGCCANKTCCATSHERTGPPVQPSAKSSSDQQTFATVLALPGLALFVRDATESYVVSSEKFAAHSPAQFTLICIRLI
jgi:hypothetical protein